ncbi:3D domain-containing protein [Paenibacillus odorifer]|uniref:3D domain-containing protein n=1 Tax=Paenibacillus odorifer TaxID=189426 RepID=UPI0015BA8AC2|nr:3D domain-containing protein [Paenibacillus odorifer]
MEEPTEEPEWTTFEATAYIALCDTGCSGFTATEYDVRHTVEYEGRRVIAVDPAVIPLGTAVEVHTANGVIIEAIAWDTGGAIKGRKIDVLMADIDDAWDFGRQAVQIRILKETVK